MKRILLFITLIALQFQLCGQSAESPEAKAQRMQWFKDAKLGIFIHWGIYAVKGIDESWSFYNELLPYDEYMEQAEGFTASSYDPSLWAKLIRESGAKYAVLTSKHHDGMALWDTEQGDLSVAGKTPAARDLVGPFCNALRDQGLRVGLYYSLLDWSYPDYPNFTKSQKRYTEDPERWARFTAFNFNQINEVITRFNPDLVWFDGDWEQSAEKWKAAELRAMLLEHNPEVIINSRLQGYGDYATPEQGIPVSRPKEPFWELCMTMNDSWGYQGRDTNYKPLSLVVWVFADVIGNGGNLLLDIGPRADGTICPEQLELLAGLGRWTARHSEAIYGSLAGLPKDCYYGPSTLSRDSATLYLFVPGKSRIADSGSPTPLSANPSIVLLKGVKNTVKSIRVVGTADTADHKVWLRPWWSSHAGLITISIPAEALDEVMTVLAVELEGKLETED